MFSERNDEALASFWDVLDELRHHAEELKEQKPSDSYDIGERVLEALREVEKIALEWEELN